MSNYIAFLGELFVYVFWVCVQTVTPLLLLFTRLRTEDMLAMSEHKDLGEKSITQLVDAAVTFDLLSVKLEKPVCLELSSQPKPARQSNCKGDFWVILLKPYYMNMCCVQQIHTLNRVTVSNTCNHVLNPNLFESQFRCWIITKYQILILESESILTYYWGYDCFIKLLCILNM